MILNSKNASKNENRNENFFTQYTADLFNSDTTTQKAVASGEKTDSSRFILKNISTLRSYQGAYISEEGIDLSIEIKNNKLYSSVGKDSALLGLDSLNTYSMAVAPQVKFTFGITGKDTGIVVTTPDE